jgi:Collagen triple helix repeat (20 copies)
MRSRITPSMVVAIAALVAALGGSAIAASHYLITSTSQIKPSVRAKLHGAKGAQGPTGAKGDTGTAGSAGAKGADGANGTNGTNGINGTNGTPGSARAYALVTTVGGLIFSKNIASATPVATGEYCIHPAAAAGIDITTTQPVATVDYTGNNAPDVIAEIRSSSADCPGALEVMMWRQSVSAGALVSTLTNEEFFVAIP